MDGVCRISSCQDDRQTGSSSTKQSSFVESTVDLVSLSDPLTLTSAEDLDSAPQFTGNHELVHDITIVCMTSSYTRCGS